MKKIMMMLMVLIIALPVAVNAAFSDVASNHWAKTYITKLVKENVIAGYPDGTFKPDNTLSKGAFLKLIISATFSEIDFSKVAGDFNHWAAPYFKVAEDYGILKEVNITPQNIDQPISRLEVVKILSLCDLVINDKSLCELPEQEKIDEVQGLVNIEKYEIIMEYLSDGDTSQYYKDDVNPKNTKTYEAIVTGEKDLDKLLNQPCKTGVFEFTKSSLVDISEFPKVQGYKFGIALSDVSDTIETGSIVLIPNGATNIAESAISIENFIILNKFKDMKGSAALDLQLLTHAVQKEYINGYPDGTFRPNNSLTRAEASKIIKLYMDDAKNKNNFDINKYEGYKLSAFVQEVSNVHSAVLDNLTNVSVSYAMQGVTLKSYQMLYAVVTGNLTGTYTTMNGEDITQHSENDKSVTGKIYQRIDSSNAYKNMGISLPTIRNSKFGWYITKSGKVFNATGCTVNRKTFFTAVLYYDGELEMSKEDIFNTYAIRAEVIAKAIEEGKNGAIELTGDALMK